MLVSLELFKQHVRADDFAADDALLCHYLETAEAHVIASTNRTATELLEMSGRPDALPLPLQQAVMMLAAHWYNQRESVGTVQMAEVPDGLQALVKPYRRLTAQ